METYSTLLHMLAVLLLSPTSPTAILAAILDTRQPYWQPYWQPYRTPDSHTEHRIITTHNSKEASNQWVLSFSGTYRCDVQDATFHRVKRVYWGIRVLPPGVLNLDYESSLAQWDSSGYQHNQTVPDQRMPFFYTVRLVFCTGTTLKTKIIRKNTNKKQKSSHQQLFCCVHTCRCWSA